MATLRPSARATEAQLTASRVDRMAPGRDAFQAQRRSARVVMKKRVFDFVRITGPVYAVEVGREVGLRYSQANALLRELEREGQLTSEVKASPLSGLGRRYYRAKVGA